MTAVIFVYSVSPSNARVSTASIAMHGYKSLVVHPAALLWMSVLEGAFYEKQAARFVTFIIALSRGSVEVGCVSPRNIWKYFT